MPINVNGQTIEDDRIEQEYQRLQRNRQGAFSQNSNETPEEDPELRQRAKDNLIEQSLIQQAIENEQPEVPDKEVEQEMQKMMAFHGGEQAFLQRIGYTADQKPIIREKIAYDMKIRKLLDEKAQNRIEEPSEEEVRTHFDTNAQQFETPEQISVSHIVKTAQGGQRQQNYEELQRVREKLLDGADFAETANAYSDCQNEPGGDLGTFSPGKMVEAFETVVFSMRAGEISPVFITDFGYHIAKVNDWQPARQSTFEEASPKVREELTQQKKREATEAYIQELRSQADIREDGNDAGSSSSKQKKQ